jgi:hypothetical protein
MKKILKTLVKKWREDLKNLEPSGWYDGDPREHYRLLKCIKELDVHINENMSDKEVCH